jgi:hypothetical protein
VLAIRALLVHPGRHAPPAHRFMWNTELARDLGHAVALRDARGDALAVAGYTLEKIESNNHASDMYIALLMENSQVS